MEKHLYHVLEDLGILRIIRTHSSQQLAHIVDQTGEMFIFALQQQHDDQTVFHRLHR
ncbi:hypothetical protein D3C75_1163740 [compost metagenome]